ncbi:hypothetical protein Dimus_006448 [Dionaea muscipula]
MAAAEPPPELSDLPDSVLHPLLSTNLSPSTAIQGTLETLIEASRTADGRSDLASKSILPAVLLLVSSLSEHQSSPSHRHLFLLSLRLLRNLCAGEALNQDSFFEHNGVDTVSNLISSLGLGGGESDYGILRTGLQVLANVALGGERQRIAIWRRFFVLGFAEIATVRRREVCDPLCMVVYVCCDGNGELFAELCDGPGLALMAEIVRTTLSVGYEEDWIKLLLSRICLDEPYFPMLINALSPDNDAKQGSGDLLPEQAFLMRMVSVVLNERMEEIHAGRDLVLFVLSIFKKAVGKVDFAKRGSSALPTGIAFIDILGYSLSMLRDICASSSSGDVVDELLSWGLLDLLLSLLGELEPPSTIRKAIIKQDQTQSSQPMKVCPYKGFRKDIVSVIGNCLYRRRNVQDELRQKNGILLLLQQCVFDEDNPFLREWGIWAIRNLLEGNEENQKAVSVLELQGSVDVPEITGLGLRVEVDPSTRRAKLVNII